jgi:hypothetical protein
MGNRTKGGFPTSGNGRLIIMFEQLWGGLS